FRYDKLVLILGFSKDKDIKGVCGQLVPAADEIVLTKASVARAADPLLVRGYVKNKEVKITNDVKEALGRAFKLAGKGDMILAAGSFFVIGEIRKLLVGAERE
ncbi:MAG: bifunctional folylpolyglutamate synthase/dihydrofolate synthase, partial [Candidatus Omnitrophota bacterium]